MPGLLPGVLYELPASAYAKGSILILYSLIPASLSRSPA